MIALCQCQQNFNSKTSLSEINFDDEDLLAIIQGRDINKAHRHEDLSIAMIRLYDSAIIRLPTLSIIFKNRLASGIFPAIWKKLNIVPAHKKRDKQKLLIITNQFLYYLL